MKIKFDLTDETTVTNTTVKVISIISGQVGTDDRPAIDKRVQEIAHRLFDDVDWAFSNFTYQNNGMMFQVIATCRIDSTRNDQLDERTSCVGNRFTTIKIGNIDASIPVREIRNAQSRLRQRLIEIAGQEAIALGGHIREVSFDEKPVARMIASQASYSNSYENSIDGGGAVGHSEKISLTAKIEVETALEGEPA